MVREEQRFTAIIFLTDSSPIPALLCCDWVEPITLICLLRLCMMSKLNFCVECNSKVQVLLEDRARMREGTRNYCANIVC